MTLTCRDSRWGISALTNSATRGSENLPTSAHSRTGKPIRCPSSHLATMRGGAFVARPCGRANAAKRDPRQVTRVPGPRPSFDDCLTVAAAVASVAYGQDLPKSDALI